ncbi:MAG: tryptophan synthase subunit alpha [Oscillospiraceae bacterium]|nr:tryptophan synthase subunit alpha [Oscillospiraceae bacterium]
MSKIAQAFSDGKAFIPFVTGGDPDIETTVNLLFALQDAGANAIEIGIPFSDPVAEGPVIEAASGRALSNGCTVDKLFDMVGRIREEIMVPILFMTYYNPIFSYGTDRFLARCAQAGLDGLIVPDLPYEEREELYQPCRSHDLELISLIAPTTGERIDEIARNSSGFLYCVSSLGVTGMRSVIDDSAKKMIAQVRAVSDIPCAVGFGISTPQQAKEMVKFADGVIVGSAIVKIVAEHGKGCVKPVFQLARSIKEVL